MSNGRDFLKLFGAGALVIPAAAATGAPIGDAVRLIEPAKVEPASFMCIESPPTMGQYECTVFLTDERGVSYRIDHAAYLLRMDTQIIDISSCDGIARKARGSSTMTFEVIGQPHYKIRGVSDLEFKR